MAFCEDRIVVKSLLGDDRVRLDCGVHGSTVAEASRGESSAKIGADRCADSRFSATVESAQGGVAV